LLLANSSLKIDRVSVVFPVGRSRRAPRALRALGQWARMACAVVTLLVVAMPAAFGATLGSVVHGLGGSSEHVCKCGMPVGRCCCAACERLERERLREQQPSPLPTLKRHCDDEAPSMPLGAALPAGVLAASSSATLSVPRGDRIPVDAVTSLHTSTKDQPPTPPPRFASV
jgi:hypothetical protein